MTESSAASQDKPRTYDRIAELLSHPGSIEIIVCAAAIVAFIGTSAFGFVHDDRAQILQNPNITSWYRVFSYFSNDVWSSYDPTLAHNYYRPLFFVWFRINYLFFKLQPAGWHILAILLHAAVSVLAFRVAASITRDRLVGGIAGLLFAVHPIHIESVAWLSGATDPLMALFVLSAILTFLSWMETGQTRKLIATALLYLMALLSKEPAMMLLPTLAILVWLVPQEHRKFSRNNGLMQGVGPMVLLSLVYLLIRAHILQGVAHSINQLPAAGLFYSLPQVALFYVRQAFMPVGLSFAYDLPFQSIATGQYFWLPLAQLVFLAVLFAFWCYRSPDYRNSLLGGAAIFLMFLLPVMNVRWFSAQDMVHDRYLYLPILGLCIMGGVLIRQWMLKSGIEQLELPQLATIGTLSVVLVLGTVSQQLYCASDLLLWSRAVRVSPNSDWALCNLGTVQFEQGRTDDAVQTFNRALQRDPKSWTANYSMGYLLSNVHRNDVAERYLLRAIELDPGKPNEYLMLGRVELGLGKVEQAEQMMRRAVSMAPSEEGTHLGLGVVLMERGDKVGAEREFLEEQRLFPDSKVAVQALAQLHVSASKQNEPVKHP